MSPSPSLFPVTLKPFYHPPCGFQQIQSATLNHNAKVGLNSIPKNLRGEGGVFLREKEVTSPTSAFLFVWLVKVAYCRQNVKATLREECRHQPFLNSLWHDGSILSNGIWLSYTNWKFNLGHKLWCTLQYTFIMLLCIVAVTLIYRRTPNSTSVSVKPICQSLSGDISM